MLFSTGYCLLIRGINSCTRNRSSIFNINGGDAFRVSFVDMCDIYIHADLPFFTLLWNFSLSLYFMQSKFLLNENFRYAKSRMGMRSKKSR